MYNRNSKTNKDGSKTLSVTMTCNHTGCKASFNGKTNTDVFLQSKAAGWLIGKTDQHICETHRKLYKLDNGIAVVRPAKAEKAATPSKSKVAQSKVERKGAAKVTKGGTKVSVGNRVAPKGDKTSAPIGQSTGKLAKSARKSK